MGFSIRLCLALTAGVILAGCVGIGVTTKVELQDRLVSQSRKNANYQTLARYWDDNARKIVVLDSPTGMSFLKVWDRENKAEITIGSGPYYGMIELVGLDEKTTLIKTYSWGGFAGMLDEWKTLIENAPEK